jgi:hypothetical protein
MYHKTREKKWNVIVFKYTPLYSHGQLSITLYSMFILFISQSDVLGRLSLSDVF